MNFIQFKLVVTNPNYRLIAIDHKQNITVIYFAHDDSRTITSFYLCNMCSRIIHYITLNKETAEYIINGR